jgi:putative redox protein
VSTIRVRLRERGACTVEHVESGAVVSTDAAPEFGGGGRSFSSTDLLAAALGTCIATSIDTVALRHGVPLDSFLFTVHKTLAHYPKRITALHVQVDCAAAMGPGVLERLRHAAGACVVHHSLHPDLDVQIEFRTGTHAGPPA